MPNRAPTHSDLIYARVHDRALALDLYLPASAPRPYPLIAWIHGGAWRMGDKTWCDELLPLLDDGYAVASVDYRLSQEAVFPAQIRDVKAAVRWLRQHAQEYGCDPDRIAAAGSSAGAHLAALLGVSFYQRAWDRQGDYTGCAPETLSSAVQAVVDWYGPTDFLRMDDEPGEGHLSAGSPESQLIGGPLQDHPERVAQASPLRYAYPGFPPFLILHGDRDSTVIPSQSVLLHDALAQAGCPVEFHLIPGAGHGFTGADYQQALAYTRAFLDRSLRAASEPGLVHYACTTESFRPRTRHAVRWLNPHDDYALARVYWNRLPDNDLSEPDWLAAHDSGMSYAAVIEDGAIISTAAVLRFSEAAWELAAVSTLDPERRNQGYARSACSFVTRYILGTGRIATLSTGVENAEMRQAVESIGFQQVS